MKRKTIKTSIFAIAAVGSLITLAACSSDGYTETSIGVRAHDRGYANPFERGPNGDLDHDGIPNRFDHDRDGDGVPNRFDYAPRDPDL